jgi:hypothetical protein
MENLTWGFSPPSWENPCPTKSGTFMGDRIVHPFFQKAAFENFGNILAFWTRMPWTHAARADRVQKTKVVKSKIGIRSFIHLTQSEILTVHKKLSQTWATAAEFWFLRSSLTFESRRWSWIWFQGSFIEWMRLFLSYMMGNCDANKSQR